MPSKFLAAALLASAAAFGPATTAFADDMSTSGTATDYAYPEFWTTNSAPGQQSGIASAYQTRGPSIGLYGMSTHRDDGAYLFEPNPFW